MFDLITAHDFYTMLVQDFDDLMEEPHSAGRAGVISCRFYITFA